MIRLLTAIIWVAGLSGMTWVSLQMLASGASLLTIAEFVSIVIVGGSTPACLFYGVFRPRSRSVSTPRRGLSLPGPLAILAFPFTVLLFIVCGDSLEDEIRARNYRHGMASDQKEKEGRFNEKAIKKADREARLAWLRSHP